MYDELEEPKSTSEFLQLKNVTLAKAVHAFSRLISIFEGKKFGGGSEVSEIKFTIENGHDLCKSSIESVDEKHILTQSTQCFEPYS